MSSYEKPLGEDALRVGWDEPMNTFFAQVSVIQAEDDLRDLPLKLWLGGKFNEYTELAEFYTRLKESGYELEGSVFNQLRLDQARSGASIPVALMEADGWTKKR